MIVRVHTDGARACPAARLGRRLRRLRGWEVERAPADDRTPPPGGALGIRVASVVRPTLTVDASVAPGADAERATALGASPLAWEGDDDWSPWERCRGPLAAMPIAGAPDLRARWVLVEDRHAAVVPARAAPGWQWHVIGEPASAPHAVVWPRRSALVASLLGEASAVIASPRAGEAPSAAREAGALVMDAWRFGVPVLGPDLEAPVERWEEVPPPAFDPLLANVLSPLVARDPAVLGALARAAERGRPLFTPERVVAARERARRQQSSLPRRIEREARMLADDPRARLRELRFWAIRKATSSARPGRPAKGGAS